MRVTLVDLPNIPTVRQGHKRVIYQKSDSKSEISELADSEAPIAPSPQGEGRSEGEFHQAQLYPTG